MSYKKFQAFAQIVGSITIGLFALLGILGLFNSSNPVLAAVGLAPETPQATVPQVMNYQGILKDAAGDPLEGTYTMTFRIYDSAITTSTLWSEQHINVTARSGHFNVLLGYNTPLPTTMFTDPDRYIGVEVAPYAEMSPRQRFASVPYTFYAAQAFQAAQADHATQADHASQADHAARADHAYALSASDDNPLDAVVVDADGHVGIATASSNANLNVIGSDNDGTYAPLRIQSSDDHIMLLDGNEIDSEDTLMLNHNSAAGVDVNGGLNVHGNITLDDHKPIFFQKFVNLGNNITFNTTIPENDWICGIAGSDTENGNIDETGGGNIMRTYMFRDAGTWWIKANFKTDGGDHENWTIWIMCVDTDMAVKYDDYYSP